MNNRGFTLVELIIVVTIIGILAAVAVPAYIGQQKRATRAEAYSNLQALRLLQEEFYAENSDYTVTAVDTAAIQALLPAFLPGTGTNYAYSMTQDVDINGAAQTPCFRATATGIAGTRVEGDTFNIDCNNNRDF